MSVPTMTAPEVIALRDQLAGVLAEEMAGDARFVLSHDEERVAPDLAEFLIVSGWVKGLPE